MIMPNSVQRTMLTSVTRAELITAAVKNLHRESSPNTASTGHTLISNALSSVMNDQSSIPAVSRDAIGVVE